MNDEEFKKLEEWVKNEGAKARYISDMVDNRDFNGSKKTIKDRLIEKAITPFIIIRRKKMTDAMQFCKVCGKGISIDYDIPICEGCTDTIREEDQVYPSS